MSQYTKLSKEEIKATINKQKENAIFIFKEDSEEHHLKGIQWNKRVAPLMRKAEYIQDHYTQYPHMPVAQYYIEAAVYGWPVLEEINKLMHFEMGAAIFILDYLYKHHQLYQARSLYPRHLDKQDLPDVESFYFDKTDVLSIVHIIRHRYDDFPKNDDLIIDNINAIEQNNNDQYASMKRFHDLMHLIDEKERTKLKKSFKKDMERWDDLYFQSVNSLAEKIDDLNGRLNTAIKTNSFGYDFYEDVARKSFGEFMMPRLHTYRHAHHYHDNQLLHKELQVLRADKNLFQVAASQASCHFQHGNEHEAFLTAYHKLEQFTCSHGYGYCYALFDLLDTSFDEIYDFPEVNNIMYKVGENLPWNMNDIQASVKLKEASPQHISYLENNYTFNQMIYGLTHYILPDHLKFSEIDDVKTDPQTLEALKAVLTFIHIDQERKESKGADYQNAFRQLQESKKLNNELRESNEQLRKQLKEYKDKRHQERREEKNYQEEVKKLQEKYAEDMKELASLREVLFNRDSQTRQDTPIKIEYPYSVKHHILVFGGHVQWQNNLQSKLKGNIEFFDIDKSFNESILRNADMIFIRTDYMSHQFYDVIISAVRNYKIEIHYFKYKGNKSADEIVKADQEVS